MNEDIRLDNIRIQTITPGCFNGKNITCSVLRLDLVHSIISGNKWFKLRYYISDAKKKNKKDIVTAGGAWSNHILATAAICQLEGLNATGVIRGEKPERYSATLKRAADLGMQFLFIDREAYRKNDWPEFLHDNKYYHIPTGGYGAHGVEGAATIMDHCQHGEYSHVFCAVGTGTMAAGIANRLEGGQQLAGISVLKNNFSIRDEILKLIPQPVCRLEIIHDYHAGGYAKQSPPLLNFMNDFYRDTGIPTDFVYTGKVFFALKDLVEKDFFPSGSHVLVIHSGGLQGNQSLENGTLIF